MSFSPTDISGLTIWFDADSAANVSVNASGNVTAWNARYTPTGVSNPTLTPMVIGDINVPSVENTNNYVTGSAYGYKADGDTFNGTTYTYTSSVIANSTINNIYSGSYIFSNDISLNLLNSKNIININNCVLKYSNIKSFFSKSTNTTFSYSATYLLKKNSTNKGYIFSSTNNATTYYINADNNTYSYFGNNNNNLIISRDGGNINKDTFTNYLDSNWVIYTVVYDNILTNNSNMINKRRKYYINGVKIGSYDITTNKIEPSDFILNTTNGRAFIGNVLSTTFKNYEYSSKKGVKLYSSGYYGGMGKWVNTGSTTSYSTEYYEYTRDNTYNYTLNGFSGSIAEIIFYNEYKSPDDMRKINDYLINKWNLSNTIKRLPNNPPAIGAVIFFDDQDLTTNIQNSLKDQYSTNLIEIWNGATQITNTASIIHNTNYTVKYTITGDVSGEIITNIKKVKSIVCPTKYAFTAQTTISTLSHTGSDGSTTGLSYKWYRDNGSNQVSTDASPLSIALNNALISTIYPVVYYTDTNYGSMYYDLSSVIVIRTDKALLKTYYFLNKGNALVINTDPYFSTFTEPITYQWQNNTIDISGQIAKDISINNITVDLSGTYTLDITYNGTKYTSSTAIVDVLDNISVQDYRTGYTNSATLSVNNITGATYQWYKNSTSLGAGARSNSYTADSSGNYFVSVKKNSVSLNSNTVAVDFRTPFLVAGSAVAPKVVYNVFGRAPSYPLKLHHTTFDDRVVLFDSSGIPQLYITEPNFFALYNPSVAVKLYQIPLPSTADINPTIGVNTPAFLTTGTLTDTIQTMDNSGSKYLFVSCRGTVAGATTKHFIQIYNLPDNGTAITPYNAIFNSGASTSTTYTDGTSSHFAVSKTAPYIFWKFASNTVTATNNTINVYNVSSITRAADTSIITSFTAALTSGIKQLSTTYSGDIVCLTAGAQSAGNPGFKLFKVNHNYSAWTDDTTIYGINNQNSLLNQISNKISRDTTVNSSTAALTQTGQIALKPTVLEYSIDTDQSGQLLYLTTSYKTAQYRGSFALFKRSFQPFIATKTFNNSTAVSLQAHTFTVAQPYPSATIANKNVRVVCTDTGLTEYSFYGTITSVNFPSIDITATTTIPARSSGADFTSWNIIPMDYNLSYYYAPETANSLSYVSKSLTNPFVFNTKYIYRIPDFYLSKMNQATGLEVSGNVFSPIPIIRSNVDLSNVVVSADGAGPSFRLPYAYSLSTDGSKLLAYSNDTDISGKMGGFTILDISYRRLPITLNSSPRELQTQERLRTYNANDISGQLTSTNAHIDNMRYVFLENGSNSGQINKKRNSPLYPITTTRTYTTDTTIGEVGSWYITNGVDLSSNRYKIASEPSYLARYAAARKYYFEVNNGVNFDNSESSSKNVGENIQLRYYIDPNVSNVLGDISMNSIVNYTVPSYETDVSSSSLTASTKITQAVQQPDLLNSNTTFRDGSLQGPIPVGGVYDISRGRVQYNGYSILRNTLQKRDPRYIFSTKDLITWFNPSISKEYDLTTVPYEYGFAIRFLRGSSTSRTVLPTWGWYVNGDGTDTWSPLMATATAANTANDTYFFKYWSDTNKTKNYRFRYVDSSGSTSYRTPYVGMQVLPWNEENEDVPGTYMRDCRDLYLDISNTMATYSTTYRQQIGKIYDGSANDIGALGQFDLCGGLFMITMRASTKASLPNGTSFTIPGYDFDTTETLTAHSITRLLYDSQGNYDSPGTVLRASPINGKPTTQVYHPDISNNEYILGIAIDVSQAQSVFSGESGRWEYTTNGGTTWTALTSNSTRVLTFWSYSRTDESNKIRYVPVSGVREDDTIESIPFYVYDGSDIKSDNTPPSTSEVGNGTFKIYNDISYSLSPAARLNYTIAKYNNPPMINDAGDYTIRYKYNTKEITVNNEVRGLNSANNFNISVDDIASYFDLKDVETKYAGFSIIDVSHVILDEGADASNNFVGPYKTVNNIDISSTQILNIGTSEYDKDYTNIENYKIENTTGTYLNTTNLVGWFDANNSFKVAVDSDGKVKTIGNSYTSGMSTMSQTVLANRPAYVIDEAGFRAFKFDGTSQFLDISASNFPYTGTQFTYIIVERPQPRTSGTSSYPLIGSDISGAEGIQHEMGYTSGGNVFYSVQGNTSPATNNRTEMSNNNTTFANAGLEPIRVLTIRRDANTATAKIIMSINTASVYVTDISNTSAAFVNLPTAVFANAKHTLGRSNRVLANSQSYYKGYIYEMYFFNTNIGGTDIQKYLMKKYSIGDTITPKVSSNFAIEQPLLIVRPDLQAWFDFSEFKLMSSSLVGNSYKVSQVSNKYSTLYAYRLDISGTINQATYPSFTPGNRIKNAAMTFAGTSYYTDLSNTLASVLNTSSVQKSWTVFMVDSRQAGQTADAALLGDSAANSTFFIGYRGANTVECKIGSETASSFIFNNNATYRVWAFVYNNTEKSITVYCNNVALAYKRFTTGMTTTTLRTAIIGKDYVGQMGEILVYESNFGDSSIIEMTDMLNRKWNTVQGHSTLAESSVVAWFDAADTGRIKYGTGAAINEVNNKAIINSTYKMVQATAANQPINDASNSILFDGINDAMSFGANTISTELFNSTTSKSRSFTMMVVEKRDTDISGNNDFTSYLFDSPIQFGYSSQNNIKFKEMELQNVVPSFNSAAEPTRLWTITYDASKASIYLNNTLLGSKTDPTLGQNSAAAINIGLSSSRYYKGRLYEMIVINDPSPPYLSSLQTYMMQKYSIISPSTSLVSWIDMSDTSKISYNVANKILSITDKITNSSVFTQTSAASAPTYVASEIEGRGIARFDGSTTFMDIATGFTNQIAAKTSYTLIIVDKASTTTTANPLLGAVGLNVSYDASGIVYNGSRVPLIEGYTTTTLPVNVWTFTYNSGTLTVYNNMTKIGTFGSFGQISAWSTAYLGRSSSAYYSGDLCELRVYSSGALANLAQIQRELIEKWVCRSLDIYKTYYPVAAWFDPRDSSTIDISSGTIIRRVQNKNTMNDGMRLTQDINTGSRPTYTDTNTSITFASASSNFMYMSQELRNVFLTPNYAVNQELYRSYTIMFVEERTVNTVPNHIFGDVSVVSARNFLNISYPDVSSIQFNTGNAKKIEYPLGPSYPATEAKKLWTFSIAYTYDTSSNISGRQLNVYLNNLLINSSKLTSANYDLQKWENAVIGRHGNVYGNFKLHELLIYNNGVVNNLENIQNYLMDKHAISPTRLTASDYAISSTNAITTSDINTNLVAWFDAADSAGYDLSGTTTSINRWKNKMVSTTRVYPDVVANSYDFDVSGINATTKPTLSTSYKYGGIKFNGTSQFIIGNQDVSGMLTNRNFSIIIVEQRSKAGEYQFFASNETALLTASQTKYGYNATNTMSVVHKAATAQTVDAIQAYDSTNEPIRIWSFLYNSTATTMSVYLNNTLMKTITTIAAIDTYKQYVLGRSGDGTARYYSGTLYEMLIYVDDALTDAAKLRKIHERLMRKWLTPTLYSAPSSVYSDVVAWFDAAGLTANSTVSRITNKAPWFSSLTYLANNASTGPTCVKLSNGLNALRFDGTTNYLDISAVSPTADGFFKNVFMKNYTLLVVEKRGKDGLNPIIGGFNTAATATNKRNLFIGYDSVSNGFKVDISAGTANAAQIYQIPNATTSYSATTEPFRLWTIDNNGGTVKVFLNNVLLGSSKNITALELFNGPSVGRYRNTSGDTASYYQGDVCEIMLINKNQANLDKYQEYLMEKWSIGAETYNYVGGDNTGNLIAWFDMADRNTMDNSTRPGVINNKITKSPEYKLEQTNINNRPSVESNKYYGQSVLSFNGTDQFMNISTDLANQLLRKSYTVMIAEKREAINDACPFIGGGSTTDLQTVNLGYGKIVNTSFNLKYPSKPSATLLNYNISGGCQYIGFSTLSNTTGGTLIPSNYDLFDVSNENVRIWTFDVAWNGSNTYTVYTYVNGILLQNDDTFYKNFIACEKVSVSSHTWTTPYLGRDNDKYYNGYICEIMVFSGARLPKRAYYENYLEKKWLNIVYPFYNGVYNGVDVRMHTWFDASDKGSVITDSSDRVLRVINKAHGYGHKYAYTDINDIKKPVYKYNKINNQNVINFSKDASQNLVLHDTGRQGGNSITVYGATDANGRTNYGDYPRIRHLFMGFAVERRDISSGITTNTGANYLFNSGKRPFRIGYLNNQSVVHFDWNSVTSVNKKSIFKEENQSVHIWRVDVVGINEDCNPSGTDNTNEKYLINVYYDGNKYTQINATSTNSSYNWGSQQNFFKDINGFTGDLCELIIYKINGTNTVTTDGDVYFSVAQENSDYLKMKREIAEPIEKYLYDKWNKPTLSVKVNNNVNQLVQLKTVAWDGIKKLSAIPEKSERQSNSSYSSTEKIIKILIEKQNTPPRLSQVLDSDLTKRYGSSFLATPGKTTVQFDLTDTSGHRAIGAYELTDTDSITNTTTNGSISITMNNLFSSGLNSLLTRYSDEDKRDSKGVAIINLDRSRGRWYRAQGQVEVELTDVSSTKALLLKSDSPWSLKYVLNDQNINVPTTSYFELIGWDGTEYSELDRTDTIERPNPTTSSFSDGAVVYRYVIKSRPSILNASNNQLKNISIKKETETDISSEQVVIKELESGFNIKANSNYNLYITNYYTNSSASPQLASELLLQYLNSPNNWIDIPQSRTLLQNYINASNKIRVKTISSSLKPNFIGANVHGDNQSLLTMNVRVEDTNVNLFSTREATISINLIETNVSPIISYNGAAGTDTNGNILYDLDPIMNDISSGAWPIFNLSDTTKFIWTDNNFSTDLRVKGFAIEIVDTANGKWYARSYDDVTDTKPYDETEINANNQKFIVSDTCRLVYVPKEITGQGIAKAKIYAWDRTNQLGQTNRQIYTTTDVAESTSYSEKYILISIPVKVPNNAPEFKGQNKTVFAYQLLNGLVDNIEKTDGQDDNNSKAGVSMNYILESIIGSEFSDTLVGTQTLSKGLAFVGCVYDISLGALQYSTNEGQTWTNFPTNLSDTNALLLTDSASNIIRFNFTKTTGFSATYQSPTMTVRAWDRTNGANINGIYQTVLPLGATAPYSANTASISLQITHINHAPELTADIVMEPVSIKSNETYTLDISNIFQRIGASYIETDIGDPKGVSITNIQSTCTRTSIESLGSWKRAGAVLSTPFNVLETDQTTIVFTPTQFSIGHTIITFKLYDGALTSTKTVQFRLNIEDVNARPVLTNTSYNPTFTVNYDSSMDISTNTIISALGATDINDNTVFGIVLYTENGIYNTETGTLQYKLKGGSTWNTIAQTATLSTAVHLSPDSELRYTPQDNDNTSTSIKVLAWDRYNVDAASASNYTRRAFGITDISSVPLSRNEYSPYSTDSITLTFQNVLRNFAPDISENPIVLDSITNVAAGSSYTIADLIGRITSYSDANRGHTKNIVITGQDIYGGLWEYSTDGTSWTAFDFTGGKIYHFAATNTEFIRYRTTSNITDYTTLTYKAWDATDISSISVSYPHITTTSTAYTKYGAYSEKSAVFRVSTVHENARPVLAPVTVQLSPFNGYYVIGTTNPWTRVSTLTSINISDPDASLTKRSNVPEVAVADISFAIAIVDASNAFGTWYYSPTGTDVDQHELSAASETNAIIVNRTHFITYKPTTNKDISNIDLRFRAVEHYIDVNTKQSLASGTVIDTSDISITTASYSDTIGVIRTSITHVNRAPRLAAGTDSLYTFPVVYGDNLDNADNSGVSVKEIMDSADFAAAYSDDDITTGVISSTEKGIYLAGFSGVAGTWQYKMPTDTTWRTLVISAGSGVLLDYNENTKVRFIPSANQNGDAYLNIHGWDKKNGTAGSSEMVLASNKGDPKTLSDNSRTLQQSTVYMNHRPSFTNATYTVPSTKGNNADNNGTTITSLISADSLGFTDRDVKDATTKGIAIVSYGVNADVSGYFQHYDGSDWIDIDFIDSTTVYLINTLTDKIRFNNTVNPVLDSSASLVVYAWDGSELQNGLQDLATATASTSTSTATSTIIFPILHVNYAPDVSGTYAYPYNLRTDNKIVIDNVMSTFEGLTITEVLNGFQQNTTIYSDVNSLDRRGMAIFDIENGNGAGEWKYKIGNASPVSISLSQNQAIYIKEFETGSNIPNRLIYTHTSVRAKDNKNYKIEFAFNAWDQTNGATTGAYVSNYRNIPRGGSSSLSANDATFIFNVQYVVKPPEPVIPPVLQTANRTGKITKTIKK